MNNQVECPFKQPLSNLEFIFQEGRKDGFKDGYREGFLEGYLGEQAKDAIAKAEGN